MAQIAINRDKIAKFCRKWQITEEALFGSVLRDGFGANSDVDMLASFADDTQWGLFDLSHILESARLAVEYACDVNTAEVIPAPTLLGRSDTSHPPGVHQSFYPRTCIAPVLARR